MSGHAWRAYASPEGEPESEPASNPRARATRPTGAQDVARRERVVRNESAKLRLRRVVKDRAREGPSAVGEKNMTKSRFFLLVAKVDGTGESFFGWASSRSRRADKAHSAWHVGVAELVTEPSDRHGVATPECRRNATTSTRRDSGSPGLGPLSCDRFVGRDSRGRLTSDRVVLESSVGSPQRG